MASTYGLWGGRGASRVGRRETQRGSERPAFAVRQLRAPSYGLLLTATAKAAQISRMTSARAATMALRALASISDYIVALSRS